MKINQIADIMNSVFSQIVNETGMVNVDLSNLTDIGRKITSTSTYSDNINKYMKSVFDKVGWTMFVSEEYKPTAPDIYATDVEYGSVLEKIRVIPSDFENNNAWTFTENGGSTFNDMFGYHPATVSAKYWNSKAVYRTEPVTITEKQFSSAFVDRNELFRFIACLENSYISKMVMSHDFLIRLNIASFIAEKIKNNNGVVNILSLYNANQTTKLTAANAMTNSDFLRFAGATFKMYCDFLKQPSILYNTDEYVNYTSEENMHIVMLTDFIRSLDTYLYANTFNPNYIDFSKTKFDIVPYWQSGGTTNAYSDRSAINVIPPSESSTSKTPVVQTGIVAVVFDKRACLINARKPQTGVQPNEFDKWHNYVWMSEAGYFIDTGENGLVFTVSDEASS